MSSDATVVWGEEWGKVGAQAWPLKSVSLAVPSRGERVFAETSLAREAWRCVPPGSLFFNRPLSFGCLCLSVTV